jgi:hypothetical protein
MTTIPQNEKLLKRLNELLMAHRRLYKQERVYQRVVGLVMAELFVFARHTVTQLLMSLGLTEQDWSAWYRLLSCGRFRAEPASEVLLAETLAHVGGDEVYVVAGDGTQTPQQSQAGGFRLVAEPADAAVHGRHPRGAAVVQRQLADAGRERVQSRPAPTLVTGIHGQIAAGGP